MLKDGVINQELHEEVLIQKTKVKNPLEWEIKFKSWTVYKKFHEAQFKTAQQHILLFIVYSYASV